MKGGEDMTEETNEKMLEDLISTLLMFRGLLKTKNSEMEITHGEFVTLLNTRRLEYSEEGKKNLVKVSDISLASKVAMPTATKNINMLVGLGFLKKKSSDVDKRIVYISTTRKGKEFLDKRYEIYKKRYVGLLEHLGQEKADQLIQLLNEAADYFRRENEKAPEKE